MPPFKQAIGSFLVIGLASFSMRAVASVPAKDTPPVEEIVRLADEARGPDGEVSFKVRVRDFNRGSKLRENVYRVYSKGAHQVLVETIFPERSQGRKLLMRDNDLWLYLPSIKRPTRVSLQQRLTGEVSNGDLAKTSFRLDYKPKFSGTLQKKGETLYKVQLKARTKEATYRKVRLFVDARTFQPRRAEYFAISGKLLKVSEFSGYKQVLGKERATEVVIRDALQPSRQSRLSYFDYRRENLDDSFFAKESLP